MYLLQGTGELLSDVFELDKLFFERFLMCSNLCRFLGVTITGLLRPSLLGLLEYLLMQASMASSMEFRFFVLSCSFSDVEAVILEEEDEDEDEDEDCVVEPSTLLSFSASERLAEVECDDM